jgi:hypothetical protein
MDNPGEFAPQTSPCPTSTGDTRPRFRHAHVQNIGMLSETKAMSCS